MLHSRTLNDKASSIHKRALRIVYSYYKSTFNKLLEKDGSFIVHQKIYLVSLAIELYK